MWIKFLKDAEEVDKKHYKDEIKDIHIGTALGWVDAKIAVSVDKPEDGKAVIKRPASKTAKK